MTVIVAEHSAEANATFDFRAALVFERDGLRDMVVEPLMIALGMIQLDSRMPILPKFGLFCTGGTRGKGILDLSMT